MQELKEREEVKREEEEKNRELIKRQQQEIEELKEKQSPKKSSPPPASNQTNMVEQIEKEQILETRLFKSQVIEMIALMKKDQQA